LLGKKILKLQKSILSEPRPITIVGLLEEGEIGRASLFATIFPSGDPQRGSIAAHGMSNEVRACSWRIKKHN
jgi:hypothetical protein